MDSSLTVSHHSFMTSDAGTTSTTSYLARHEGQIVYEVAGQGPLIVLVPDMGDLLATYRFLAPQLRRAAYRVAECDLRGHGDSDVTFSGYGDEETASDLVALIDELSGPAVVAGNSMGAAAAVLAAADRPDLVVGPCASWPFPSRSRLELHRPLRAPLGAQPAPGGDHMARLYAKALCRATP